MKKIKVIIVLLILVLITGCSGTYNLNIGKDLSVKEELNIVLEDEAGNYDKILTLFNNKGIDVSKYKIVTEDNDLNIEYKDEYDSLEDYLLNSFIYKQLFEKISYNTDRKTYSLEVNNVFNNTNPNLSNANKIKLLQINVTTPLNIIDENSDSSTEDTYSWTITDKTKEKDAYIIFSVKEKIVSFSSILVISMFAIVIIIFVGIVIKRLLDARKI